MINLSDPTVESLTASLVDAICNKIKVSCPYDCHNRVRAMYSWGMVATNTVKVYDNIALRPRLTFVERVERYSTKGSLGGFVSTLVATSVHLFYKLVCFLQPIDSIDVVPDVRNKVISNISKS